MANASVAFLDDQIAAGRGDRPAIVTAVGTVVYRELLALACRVGNALRTLGVAPEKRVAMLLPDGVAWAATFFGALRIGAVAVPLNTRLTASEWLALIHDSRAKVLVADASLVGVTESDLARVPGLTAIVTARSDGGGLGLDVLVDRRNRGAARDLLTVASSALEPEPVSDDDMAFWLYTSGTTGRPKAAVHGHRDLLACRHYGIEVLGAGVHDRVFATSKLFFAYALGNALLIPLFVGAQTYLAPSWPDPESVAGVLRAYRPTLFFSVPTFYARLLRAELPRELFASLRCAVSAGERLPEEIYRAFRDRFGVEILDGLGATETIYMVLSNRPGRSRAGSAGTPVPGTEVRLLAGQDGHREVAEGEPGVLHVRTPSASPMYWGRPDESRRAFLGEWFRTGDVCTRDADGFYAHTGRVDDLFKVAGLWVVPAAIEAVLMTHAGVADAGVVGAEAEGGLVKPFAWIVPSHAAGDPTALLDELGALAVEKLPAHQRPRAIALAGELPRTSTGKLQRHVLREWRRSR